MVAPLDVAQCQLLVFGRGGGHQARNGFKSGRLHQNAVGYALTVAQYFSTFGVGCVQMNTCQIECHGVGHSGMANTRQVHRTIGASGVEFLPCGVALLLKIHHMPTATAADPGFMGVGLGIGANGGLNVGYRARLREVNQPALHPGPVHVIVRVNEAWNEGALDFVCFTHGAQNGAHIDFATHSNDLARHNADGLSPRLGRVHGDDLAQQ